jgi:hypothetical protein
MPKPHFMKRIPVLVILSLPAVFASAQQKKTDNLILKSAPDDELSDKRTGTSTTIKYALEEIAPSKKIDKPKEEEYFLLMPGGGYFNLNNTNQVIIKAKSNGIGIPDTIKDKIVQPFFTTKLTGEETGLGLWWAEFIIRLSAN